MPSTAPGGPHRPDSWPLLRTMVGTALRRARLRQRRTLADVARAAQVSMQYLSEIERGRKEPSSEVLAAVCTALRIDLPDLLADVGREMTAARPARLALVTRLGSQPGQAELRRAGPRPAGPVCLAA